MTSPAPQGGGTLLVLLAFMAIMNHLRRQGRKDPAAATLLPRQRIRPMAMQWLDAVFVVVFFGISDRTLAPRLVSTPAHLALSGVGAVVGMIIGLARARAMFVRALPTSRAVVLTRSGREYVLVGLLIILRVVEAAIVTGPWSVLVLALVVLAMVDSIVRSAEITRLYRADTRRQEERAGESGRPGG